MDWWRTAIPRALAARIKNIYAILGYKSMSDFVQKAVMDKLPREESRYDEVQEAIKSGEYQKWEK